MSDAKSTTNFILPVSQWKSMEAHLRRCLPEEGCGVIINKGGGQLEAVAVTNALHSPVRFRMDAREQLDVMIQMDENDWDLAGIYHSHPLGPEHPSATDLDEAAFPEAIYLIWFPQAGDWDCRAYTLQDGSYTEVPIRLVPE
ncbi:MAG: M67 family metallopeptidase [Anaerolineales bacterium]|jgi:proteasome lid subunit RPN8/RPN11